MSRESSSSLSSTENIRLSLLYNHHQREREREVSMLTLSCVPSFFLLRLYGFHISSRNNICSSGESLERNLSCNPKMDMRIHIFVLARFAWKNIWIVGAGCGGWWWWLRCLFEFKMIVYWIGMKFLTWQIHKCWDRLKVDSWLHYYYAQ